MQTYSSRMLAIATVFAVVALCTGGGMTANAQYTPDNYYPPTPPQGAPPATQGEHAKPEDGKKHKGEKESPPPG